MQYSVVQVSTVSSIFALFKIHSVSIIAASQQLLNKYYLNLANLLCFIFLITLKLSKF